MSSLWFTEEVCQCCGHVKRTLRAKTMNGREPILYAPEEERIVDWATFKNSVMKAGSVERQGQSIVSAERFFSLLETWRKTGRDSQSGLLDSFRDEEGWLFTKRKFA